MNRVTASFRRGYYRNETLVYTSTREETKEVIIYVRNGGNLNMDIVADPAVGGKPAFSVYRKSDKERMVLKSVPQFSDERGIELYRD